MRIKLDNPSPNYFKGDNSRGFISSEGLGYPLWFLSQFLISNQFYMGTNLVLVLMIF